MILSPDKVEIWGALRFSPFWISVDGLLILHFFWMWRRSAKKSGWKLDFWFFSLLLSLFFPILLMYPFSAAPLNIAAAGNSYEVLEPAVDWAFAIACLGYLFIWLGRSVYDWLGPKCPLYALCLLFHPLEQIVAKNVRSKQAVFFLTALSFFLSSALLFLVIREGYFLKPRSFFSQHEGLRPIFNLAITLIPLSLLFLGLRWLRFQEKTSRWLLAALLFFSFAFGLRAVTLYGALVVVVYSFFAKQGRIGILKLCGLGFLFAFAALYLDHLRHGEYNPLVMLQKSFFSFFYGNHFSDLRDFAWTLAYWDENYLYGKSYAAGLISFLPRFLSAYRQEWSYFFSMNRFLGLDPDEHPGLRPSIFGEAFFNFGYLGVILLGFLIGYFLRYADVKLKESVVLRGDIIEGYSKTIVYAFLSAFFITVGIWGFYLFLLINLSLAGIFHVVLRKKIVKNSL